MTPERFQRIDQLLSLALERPVSDRRAFIRESCGGDETLRIEVESLLASHEETEGFSMQAPSQLAAELLQEQSTGLAKSTTPGRYQVVGELGTGGMGVIYAAYDPELCRKVALKLVRPQTSALFPASQAQARLLREARAMAQLSHPNVVAVHDVGTAGESVFIAMEHVEGSALSHWLEDGKRPWREVLSIFLQAGRGLAAAHAAGILHRDFKPENVLVGKDGRARVTDFGLARVQPPNGGEEIATGAPRVAAAENQPDSWARRATLSGPGKLFGTPGYMAPEQLTGQPATEKTDQFSFCVALYQGLYGEPPFEGETTASVLSEMKQGQAKLPPLSSSIPAELGQLVLRGLSFNPADRHSSMEALLEALERQTRQPPVEQTASSSGLRARPATRLVAACGIAVFIIGATGLYWGAQRRAARSQSGAVRSLVVLPFINAGGDAEMEYLSDGIAEALIDNLSQIPELKVIARHTAFRYKGANIDSQRLGRELSVDAALTGRIQQHGSTLAIRAELVNLGSGLQLWGEKYDRKLTDLLGVEDEIAQAISGKIRLRFTPEVQQRVTKRYTENPRAYQLYLRGRYLLHKRTTESVSKALEYFQQAIDLDPNYSIAYTGMADCYLLLREAYEHVPWQERYARAETAALKALALDDELAEAHASLGIVKLLGWDWITAEKELKRAIALNPNYASAHNWYFLYLHKILHIDEAAVEIARAQRLDPASAFYASNLSSVLCYKGQHVQAIAQYNEAIRLESNFEAYFRADLGHICYSPSGRYQEAIDQLQQALALKPGQPSIQASLAYALARSGNKDRALSILEELKERDQSLDLATAIAHVYLGLEDKERAFEWLEKAYQRHSTLLTDLKVDRTYDPLRSDPRFADLLRRIGFPQ